MARTSQFPPSVDPGVPRPWPTPPGWHCAPFRELVELVERPVELQDDTEYQLVIAKRSRGGIVPRGRMRGREILVKDQYRVEPGDFLMSARQIIHGACGLVPEELAGAVVSNEYVVLRPREMLLPEYLRQLSHTGFFQRTCFHSSVGVDVEKMVFKVDRWLSYRVAIPSLAEQQRVVDLLGAVDEAIAAAESVLQELHRVRDRLLVQLMTSGVQCGPVKSTAAGPCPSAWVETTVGDLATEISYGTSTKLGSDATAHPVLRIPNVVGDTIDSNLKYASLPAPEVESLRLVEGDLLVVRTNGNPDYVGRSLVFPASGGTWLFASYLIRVRVDRARVLPAFLHYAMQAPGTRRSIEKGIRTSAGNYNLNTQGIRATKVNLPPIPEQQVIVDALNAVRERIASERETLARLVQVKSSTLNRLMAGDVRVPLDARTLT